MRLSRLYTNEPSVFAPIDFKDGLNAIVAEIRIPENRAKDTHNLGKSTLGRVLDFCLLKDGRRDFFLFKHKERFEGLTFYLEIKLLGGDYITVRREVDRASRIAFKRHSASRQDLSSLSETDWDHADVPLQKARDLLDGVLDLRALSPWSYRKLVGYLLRAQDDFRDVFQLRKFAGPHADWKPFLAHILGFDADLLVKHYEKEAEIEVKSAEAAAAREELGGTVSDMSKIEGLMLLKQNAAEKKQELLDAFDFQEADTEKTKLVVEHLDASIASLNAQRYSLERTRRRLTDALAGGEIQFSTTSAQKLFEEAGVYFGGQLKKDFDQLISFNRAVTSERGTYLREELAEVESELSDVSKSICDLGQQRKEVLSFLRDRDVFHKYKQLSDELVNLRADIQSLERQRECIARLQELRTALRVLGDEKERLQTRIEEDVEQKNADKESLFSAIRLHFNEAIEEVIGREALLSAAPNKLGHLEFKAEILDGTGNATSADSGFSYRKLLCVAFDLAVARAHLAGNYPRFVFHDGVFESLDERKKVNLLGVMRTYSALGIQHIVTAIDTDLPTTPGVGFEKSEVVLSLHDEGESGRLFKIPTW